MRLIVDLAGGFGNQLFCYAFGYALKRERNQSVYYDTTMQDSGVARPLGIDKLCVDLENRVRYTYRRDIISRAIINKIKKVLAIGGPIKTYKEKKATVYEPSAFLVKGSCYFKGNWMSEKYFKKYREDLLKLFVPKQDFSAQGNVIAGDVEHCNSVAVHVRRGDYLRIGCQLDVSYYDNAIALITEKLHAPLNFYVFSDDLAYCKKYFAEHYPGLSIVYPEYETDNGTIDDLFLMSKCKHMIMANSSYSWWAAWLNQNESKIVVCPEVGMWKGDVYPEKWLKVQASYARPNLSK